MQFEHQEIHSFIQSIHKLLSTTFPISSATKGPQVALTVPLRETCPSFIFMDFTLTCKTSIIYLAARRVPRQDTESCHIGRWKKYRMSGSLETHFDCLVRESHCCKFTASPTVSNTEINDINRTCQLIMVSHPVFHRPFYEQPPPTIAPLLQWWPARPRKREWSSVRPADGYSEWWWWHG